MIHYRIFKMTNPIGEIYIGLNWNPHQTEKEIIYFLWKSNYDTKIKKSLLQHGPDSHTFEVIEQGRANTVGEAKGFRIVWIKKFGTDAPGGFNENRGNKGGILKMDGFLEVSWVNKNGKWIKKERERKQYTRKERGMMDVLDRLEMFSDFNMVIPISEREFEKDYEEDFELPPIPPEDEL